MTEEIYYTRLPSRGQILIRGKDGIKSALEFLQGLVSNDVMPLLEDPRRTLVYACLLTPQGKFLHDFFIRADDNTVYLDCEGGERAADLYQRLSVYAMLAGAELEVQKDAGVWAVFIPDQAPLPGLYKDPRHVEMGWRAYENPPQGEEKDFAFWDRKRIELCIPDGSRDLEIERSTPDEGRLDQLNGISYKKGCYVGQEVVARMHYRGLGKKHLQTVKLDEPLPEKSELRSTCGDVGLALVRAL